MDDISILIVAESLDIAQDINRVIDTGTKNYYIATELTEAINLYETCSPKVMLFAHDKVDTSQLLYFQIIKSAHKIDNNKHEAILLCNHDNVKNAYDMCMQKLFFDYVVINPKFDRMHINLVIDKALASCADVSKGVQVREFAKAANNIEDLNTDVLGVVQKVPNMKDLTAQSLDELNKKMQADIKGLSERIKNRVSEKTSNEELSNAIDEEVDLFSKSSIDEGIDVSQIQIDKIVNRWGAELQQVQEKHAPSLVKISKLSTETRKMVLIVEDNEVYSDIIDKMITGTGKLDTQLKGSVHHGLTSMVCDRPDLVLLDYELPDGDATVFLNKVSQIDTVKDIPVVILTSHNSRDIVNTVLTQGAVDFVVKPASKKIILEKIRKWIKRFH